MKYDPLRQQRLAAPVKVYVEQFSAHPLERDAADLYGPPDGYIDVDGHFHKDQRGADGQAGLRGRTASRRTDFIRCPTWRCRRTASLGKRNAPSPSAPDEQARQGFFPDGSRSFEDIDRMAIGVDGKASMISSQATVDFYRLLPPGGYRKGLPAALRTDVGEGDIAPETRGKDFFPYKPRHLGSSPPRPALARVTNIAQKVMSSGQYDGAIFTQGSPAVEETAYWFNLLIDTTKPICGNAAQRPQGQVSNDGPQNIVAFARLHPLAASGRTSRAAIAPASSCCRSSRLSPRAKSRRSMRGLAAITRPAAMAASSAASAIAAGRC